MLYRNMVCIWCNMLHRAQETERLREAVRLSESAEQSMAETLLNLQALAHAPYAACGPQHVAYTTVPCEGTAMGLFR